MAAGQGVTDTIVIDDFTPGIVSDFASISGSDQTAGKDGAARIVDTYGCLAGPRGGLVPAFGVAEQVTQGLIDTAARYHSGHPYMRILATCNASPVIAKGPEPDTDSAAGSGWATAYNGNLNTPDHLFVMFQSFYDNTGSGDWRRRCAVRGYKRFLATPGNHTLVNFTTPNTLTNLHADHVKFGFGAVFPYRQSQGAMDVPPVYNSRGAPIIYMAHCLTTTSDTTGEIGPGNFAYQYPDDIFDIDDTTPTAHTTIEFAYAMQHQGRIVQFSRDFGFADLGMNWYGFRLGADGVVQTGEDAYIFDFNAGVKDHDDLVDANSAQFDQDNPYGFGVYHSMNANELLVVKQRGGALLIRGDLANPTVTKLGGFPDVRNAANIGTLTPLGFIFGTRTGVYLYPGGDRAQSISPDLDGWFWKPASMVRMLDPQPYGKFGWFDPYLLAPNNWCWDSRTGAWMRYHPTPDLVGPGNGGRIYPFVEISAGDHFYAFPAGVSNSNSNEDYPNEVATRFSPTSNLPAWSWRSQPLIRTRGRRINVREVQILAQALDGAETAEVTLFGYQPGSPTTQVLGTYTFAVPDAGRPVQLVHPFYVSGGDIEIRVKTSGPINLYRLSIGYNEGPTAHV